MIPNDDEVPVAEGRQSGGSDDDLALPGGFSGVPPEARAELLDFAEWLRLPKPRTEFHAWRCERRSAECPVCGDPWDTHSEAETKACDEQVEMGYCDRGTR